MSADPGGVDDAQSAECINACSRCERTLPPTLMEWLAMAFVFVRILITVVILGHAILQHALLLFAPHADGGPGRDRLKPHRHQFDIDKFGLFDIARRLRIDRSRDVRRPFGHVSPAAC
jgi:hypothetical protein